MQPVLPQKKGVVRFLFNTVRKARYRLSEGAFPKCCGGAIGPAFCRVQQDESPMPYVVLEMKSAAISAFLGPTAHFSSPGEAEPAGLGHHMCTPPSRWL